MPTFELIGDLAKKEFIFDLSLSRVLMNDTKDFPWIFLVPREPNIQQINQLSRVKQHVLVDEITLASGIMENIFPCDRINVAAIGNITPQLHIHIICRNKSDPYWSDVCWNKELELMPQVEMEKQKNKIRVQFEQVFGDVK